ncbi:MAG: hypothetical protein ACRC7S_14745 [Cetobacterium sp.]
MKKFNNINDVANYLDKSWSEILKHFENNLGHGYFMIDGICIYVRNLVDDFEFVIVDDDSNEDCREFLMEYLVKEYNWCVYVDDIEGWQDVKVLDLYTTGMDINRAVVVTANNTQLNRRAELIWDKEDVKADGCIYYIENEED